MDHRSLTSANDALYEHICPLIKMAFHRIVIDIAHLQIRTRYQSEDSTFELGLSAGAMGHLFHVLRQASNVSDILSANIPAEDSKNLHNTYDTIRYCCQVLHEGFATCQRVRERGRVEMGRISILESKRSITEAVSVKYITQFAFLFLPLNFAASVFGMNLKEKTGNRPKRFNVHSHKHHHTWCCSHIVDPQC